MWKNFLEIAVNRVKQEQDKEKRIAAAIAQREKNANKKIKNKKNF